MFDQCEAERVNAIRSDQGDKAADGGEDDEDEDDEAAGSHVGAPETAEPKAPLKFLAGHASEGLSDKK